MSQQYPQFSPQLLISFTMIKVKWNETVFSAGHFSLKLLLAAFNVSVYSLACEYERPVYFMWKYNFLLALGNLFLEIRASANKMRWNIRFPARHKCNKNMLSQVGPNLCWCSQCRISIFPSAFHLIFLPTQSQIFLQLLIIFHHIPIYMTLPSNLYLSPPAGITLSTT